MKKKVSKKMVGKAMEMMEPDADDVGGKEDMGPTSWMKAGKRMPMSKGK